METGKPTGETKRRNSTHLRQVLSEARLATLTALHTAHANQDKAVGGWERQQQQGAKKQVDKHQSRGRCEGSARVQHSSNEKVDTGTQRGTSTRGDALKTLMNMLRKSVRPTEENHSTVKSSWVPCNATTAQPWWDHRSP